MQRLLKVLCGGEGGSTALGVPYQGHFQVGWSCRVIRSDVVVQVVRVSCQKGRSAGEVKLQQSDENKQAKQCSLER